MRYVTNSLPPQNNTDVHKYLYFSKGRAALDYFILTQNSKK